MFSLFIILLSLTTHLLAVNLPAKGGVVQTFPASAIKAKEVENSCGQAYINDRVDANSLSETILWKIGTLRVAEKEINCKVSLALSYTAGWTYAITDVSWRGRVVIEPDAQATISLTAKYQGGATGFQNSWTLKDQGPGGWGRPKGDFKEGRDWEDRKLVDERSQAWSPPGQISPLNIEWRVGFQSSKTRGMLSVLGDKSKGGEGLQLRIGLKWRKI